MSHREEHRTLARGIRGWFVGYGIGAVVLFANRADFAQKVGDHASFVVIGFIAGAVIQVTMALIYKYALWCKDQDKCDFFTHILNQAWLDAVRSKA